MSYCEMPEFYFETHPKARKPQACVECCAPIDVGEVHMRYRGKWGGKIGGGRQHLLCKELCVFIRDEVNLGECIGFGDLHEYCGSYNQLSKQFECHRTARGMYAQIKWRERSHKRSVTKEKKDV